MRLLRVEVVYALPGRQTVLMIKARSGATVRECLIASGILQVHPEIELDAANVGIWSKRVMLDTVVRDGDRVEIYRPLVADPKQVRRRRAREDR